MARTTSPAAPMIEQIARAIATGDGRYDGQSAGGRIFQKRVQMMSITSRQYRGFEIRIELGPNAQNQHRYRATIRRHGQIDYEPGAFESVILDNVLSQAQKAVDRI